jgi:iron(III) transport system permease protein
MPISTSKFDVGRSRFGVNIFSRRITSLSRIVLIFLSLAIVFSPLLAACTGLDADHFSLAFDHVAKPLGRSVGMAAVSGLVALVLGVPFALLVEKSRLLFRRIFWVLGLTALVVPPYLVAEAWIVLLGPAGKIARPLAMLLGMGPKSEDPIQLARFAVPGLVFSWPAVGIVIGGCLFPIVALAVAGAYRRTDQRVFESARIAQGPRGVRTILRRVLTGPAIGASLLVFAVTLTDFAVPQLLRVRAMGELIAEQIVAQDLSAAAALSLPSLPLILIAGALGVVILSRSRASSMAGLEGEVPKFTGNPASPVGNVAAGLMTLLAITPAVILPIVYLAWLMLTSPSFGVTSNSLRPSGFGDSMRWAWELLRDDAVRSVVLAAIAATLAVVLAIAVVRSLAGSQWTWAQGVLAAGLAVPAPIIGLGLITLWNHESTAAISQTSMIVLLCWFARFLPLVVFLVQSALARVAPELESAAALVGRSPLERLITIVLRSAAPGLVTAWLAMYVLSAGEYGATSLIAPAGHGLLAPSVLDLMQRRQEYQIAACQLLLLLVIMLPLGLIGLPWIARRKAR